MPYACIKALTRTLRFQLMVWNAAVVLVLVIIALLGLREGFRLTLIHELDQLLAEDLSEVKLAIAAFGFPGSEDLFEEMDRKARGHVQHGWFVQLVDEASQRQWASINAPTDLPVPHVAELAPVTFHGVRILQRQHRRPDGSAIRIRVGTSTVYITRDLARLDRIILGALAGVLLVAPLGGYWLAGRITQPLANIIHTTERLRPAKFEERLPIHHSSDELNRLSQAFNRLLDRIARYLEQQQDFLANAAHELRTPLAAIQSTAEVALHHERSVAEYQELLTEIIDENSSLELLVNQLLLLAETEADRLKIHGERVELDALVAQACDMFRGVAEHREIRILVRELPSIAVEGNRHHLRQVVNNLLDNAIKFTPAGGTIRVALTCDDGERVARLHVHDTGMGIAAEDLPHVFERFYRGDRSRRRDVPTRGTGLGLSICQAVVAAHGGTITVESVMGQGTQFVVTLPVVGLGDGSRVEVDANSTASP